MRSTALAALALAIGNVAAQIPISQSTYSNIIQYTQFARAAYAQTCGSPPNGSAVLSYFRTTSTSASATLFRWNSQKQLIISFRGTAVPGDWSTDLDFPLTAVTLPGTSCNGCQVHEGFQKWYNSIGPQITSAIKSALAANPGYKLIVTGHSLGGALASFGTASLGASGIPIAATYTYGEPRNGNSAFGNYVLGFVTSANYYRVTHSNDGVPSIPPSAIGFSHHGNEYWERATGYNNTAATTVECPSVFGQEPLNCVLAQNFGDNPINYAHLTYSNDVIGNTLHIHACGAPYP